MKLKDKTLTDAERQFAEDNINLIHGFLHHHEYPEEEFFDVVVFGYLEAVKQYFCTEKLRKLAFSTVAFLYMRRSVQSHFTKQAAKRVVPENKLLSGDGKMYFDNETILYERIDTGHGEDFIEEIIANCAVGDLLYRLSEKDQMIVRLLIDGYKKIDIAKVLNVSHQAVDQRVKKIRKTAQEFFSDYD
jgi:RNA polymerase sigma factor (sigma-70 family)